jgi:hypothetical protein
VRKSVPPKLVLLAAGVVLVLPVPELAVPPVALVPVPLPGTVLACIPLISMMRSLWRLVAHRNGFE